MTSSGEGMDMVTGRHIYFRLCAELQMHEAVAVWIQVDTVMWLQVNPRTGRRSDQ